MFDLQVISFSKWKCYYVSNTIFKTYFPPSSKFWQGNVFKVFCLFKPWFIFDYFPQFTLGYRGVSVQVGCLSRIGSLSRCNYRPQQSWAKVIFSQACVKNSVHRGEGVCLSACWDTTPGPGKPPREQTPSWTRQTPQPAPGRPPPDQADPPTKHTPAYGLRAAGTHPTGRHYCFC